MSPDLHYLVWAAALTLFQAIFAGQAAQRQVGFAAMAGTRENLPPITGWADRAGRAHRNMLENLPLFAALVLVARVSGHANGWTALGSATFFWARLIYVPIYVLGVPMVRSVVFMISVIGLGMIFLQVV